MIIAKTEILSNEVMNKCKSKGIEAYTLKIAKQIVLPSAQTIGRGANSK